MKCVYFTYDGLLDPLGQSQVIPYIQCLVAAGHSFTVISFEKEQRSTVEILALEQRLNGVGIRWVRLRFRSGKFKFVQRITAGILSLQKICRNLGPDIVHLRGFLPAVIYKLSLLRIPHLYDFRGFAIEEWTDFGKVRAGSLSYNILRKIDRSAVETACGFVVLEKSAESLLRSKYNVPNVPLKVIRTCTDVKLFMARQTVMGVAKGNIRFVCLGGACRPYRPDLALRFVTQLGRAGVECSVSFFNQRDHAQINSAIEETSFSRDRVELLSIDHCAVPARLARYDCGLVFLDTSPWRRVCSPTKVGEYLAAGLPVISLAGVDMLEQFAATTACVKIVNKAEVEDGMAKERLEQFVAFIFTPDTPASCQELAAREFSMERAGRLYTELYAEIEARN